MVTLLDTQSLAWAESVRLALQANGIEAVVLDQHSPGAMGIVRVAIDDDADLERAAAIVADLRPPRTGPLPSWRWHKRALLLLGAGFVLVYSAAPIAASTSIHPLERVLATAGIAAFAIAFVLIFVGYRADKRRHREASKSA